MARWMRASRALRLPAGSKVLDLGCAFGFGMRHLTRRYQAYGHDLNPDYIDRARQSVPKAAFTCGSAEDVPYEDGTFDAILLLDVLEHVPDVRSVVSEIDRLLSPGGQLIISVPNQGALERIDSLNVYSRLLGNRIMPPTDDPSWAKSPVHRHYSLREIATMLGSGYRIRDVHYSGIGLAEIVHLPLVLLFRGLLRRPDAYNKAVILYVLVYVLEDQIRTGPWGYHMMIDAERL